jgi:predicted DNA-binding protein YlxM (UPF0122 family)
MDESITKEIIQLQARLAELEKQQREKFDNDKKTSISHNLQILDSLLTYKKKAIMNNRYTKAVPLSRYYDQELVTHLEAVYNCLKLLDERILKIERKL